MRDRHQILHHFLLGGDLLSTSNSLPCLRHRCCNSSNPKRANRSLWATTSIATSSATTESTRAVNLGRLKFRPTANFLDKLQVGNTFGDGKLFHDPPLVLQIRALRLG